MNASSRRKIQPPRSALPSPPPRQRRLPDSHCPPQAMASSISLSGDVHPAGRGGLLPAKALNPLLVVLDVSSNNISSAEDDALRALSALEVLRAGGNRLRDLRFLPEPCALRRLHAPRNALASLDGPLRRCALLEELDMARNELRALPAGAFFGLARLRELYLARNPLRQVAPRLFAGLTALRLLDLAFTGLTELPQGAFEGLTMLEHVNLRGNELTTLPGKVFSEQNLISLDLSKNELSTIPGLIKRLTSLEKLNLGGNGIKSVPEKYFRKCKRLRELSLSNNGILSLSADTFANLASLERLDLSRNPLSKRQPVSRLARGDGRQEDLACAGPGEGAAGVPAFPAAASTGRQPAGAAAGGSLPPPATHCARCYLGTTHGKIMQLEEDTFADLTELEKLDLHGHQLETLPKAIFKTNRHLVDLNLENNRLKKLPQTLPVLQDCCEDLTFASFENNSIAHPSEEALTALLRPEAERVVELRGNPLRPRAFLQLARLPAAGGAGGAEGVEEEAQGARVSFARDEAACACGSVRRGRAELHLCVDAPCGANDVWGLSASQHA
ncbi:Toll-like receptor Tollo [Gryllus bimaculatus]|nr:Toll-like receptor Tollo [Gryllus bimaculatus]